MYFKYNNERSIHDELDFNLISVKIEKYYNTDDYNIIRLKIKKDLRKLHLAICMMEVFNNDFSIFTNFIGRMYKCGLSKKEIKMLQYVRGYLSVNNIPN